MALRHPSRTQIALAALSLLGLTWLALMMLRSHPGGRTSVLAQLEQPATAPVAHVGPGPINTTVTVAGYAVAVRTASNHASQPQLIALRVTGPSGPVDGARVIVSYAMPSMNMPSVLTSALHGHGGGGYSARVTALEMPGDWLVSFRITPAHGRSLHVALADRMPR
jgi:YtkA-like